MKSLKLSSSYHGILFTLTSDKFIDAKFYSFKQNNLGNKYNFHVASICWCGLKREIVFMQINMSS